MKQMDMFGPGIFLTIITNFILYGMTVTYTALILGVADYDGSCDVVTSTNRTARAFGRLVRGEWEWVNMTEMPEDT